MTEALEQFRKLGALADAALAADGRGAWKSALEHQTAARAIFDAHPELHDEMRAIARGWLWSLARPKNGG